MEKVLREIYLSDGIEMFQEKYHLLEKLLNRSDNQSFTQDALLVKKIIAGNKFFTIVRDYKKKSKYQIDKNVYNVLIDQMYCGDELWKSNDYARAEKLLRFMLQLCEISVEGIPVVIEQKNTIDISPAEIKAEYELAYNCYGRCLYKTAKDRASTIFENGARNAAGLLGLLYYKGLGTKKDYNKALYYLSYPQVRDVRLIQAEEQALEKLVDMKMKSQIGSVFVMAATLVCFLFLIMSGFMQTYTLVSVVYLLIMLLGAVASVFIYIKKYIYDLSLWYLVLGCMFLSMIIG